ncbi:zinc metalloprotease HtpX [Candidatus Nomurabacteria bacterium RIFCSPLOWO2_01_FULL_42_20]|uniref:Protease HtpX homolog n=1 Tax=Candidatus Nomurabacteria bacterium RIFCSPHIGHO2_01_FULL_42_16 TaxID=1801743 RepID=A0A1F6VLB0_9BACT|nr:MAG: zinc metalloprotease HtpX [Candidatus Nomurabacteria bacterium RIFCSPHIGHO2_01_FULL_42_16]OGI91781.1 MAG: zinc metalloprotease HtpX [Candidatus Nomurabacteria bacterium RIFCSPLOWO2_01_FULL_42_20]
MATLYTHQSKNVWKTWVLMSLFFVVIIGIGWWASFYFQNPNILYFFVAFSIFMNILAYWFSDKIVLKMSGAKPASREEFFDLYTVTENLSITAGLPLPKIYVINDPAPNAFATGRNKEHAVVAVTTGLLQILERNELEGVIAHELSHIGNRDMLISTVVVVLVGFVTLISDFFLRSMFFGGMRRDNRGDGRLQLIIIIIGIALAILAPIIALLIQLAISRKREFLADASGALLTRYPEGLAGALEKISRYSRPMMKANDATAHLFIANPFGPKALRGMHRWFMTHPPLEDRIKALRGEKI